MSNPLFTDITSNAYLQCLLSGIIIGKLFSGITLFVCFLLFLVYMNPIFSHVSGHANALESESRLRDILASSLKYVGNTIKTLSEKKN